MPPESWNHCKSEDNPADIASRGVSPKRFQESTWLDGPDCLKEKQSQDEIGEKSFEESLPSECLNEMRVRDRKDCEVQEAILFASVDDPVIDCQRQSKFNKLLRVTAYVFTFISILKARVRFKEKVDPALSTEDFSQAEMYWIRNIQASLVSNSHFKEWEREFGVYQDDRGLYRCGGRLNKADLTQDQKHPILLEKEHYVTTLIVRHCHEQVHHNGVKETLTELRSRFWIVRGRQFIRRILYKCVICRRLQGRPYAAPSTPTLPGSRVSVDYPFSYTGIDFAGPLYLKDEDNPKAYISLYTCGVSRAVHLDLVPTMSAEAFLRSFRRFTSRRGVPKQVTSDNAKTFKSASRTLSALFEVPEVRDYLMTHKIQWRFNLEKSPWWGGFFERLIQSVKRCLKKTLGNARLTYEELLTVLADIEATLNSRPLSFVSSEDLEEPLTPSHLLQGRRLLTLPTSCPDESDLEEVDADELGRRAKYMGSLMQKFWERWSNEYLLELRNSHRMKPQPQSAESVNVGDVVIVHDDNKKRRDWRMGHVFKLIRGADGSVRGAELQVITRSGKVTKIKRPVQKLYPVEMSQRAGTKEQSSADVDNSTVTEDPVAAESAVPDAASRPKRAAARRADEERRRMIVSQRL